MVNVDEKILNKEVQLVYDDGIKPFFMRGKILGYNSHFLIFLTEGKERAIPMSRVIRIEEERP
ncbi:MAG: Alanyl-tRNA synthetase [Candidatus Fermentimicrarchaeum limneticum]|uniref:Alanyl-tRNA synthetase n=1 Tax=Fermentimicrarchaeum limneticum TaxID=2795018 RepID=A0A7D5XLQ4_FERL1|nr:MAG: Alanyl-tRNA synthetase [Candidatus Fermentimicrarchaeum limneticum]